MNQPLSLLEVVLLATQTLAAVKSYDEYCGGRSELIVLTSDGRWSPVAHPETIDTETYIGGYEKHVRKLMFGVGNPQLGDDEFQARLNAFIEAIKLIGKHG